MPLTIADQRGALHRPGGRPAQNKRWSAPRGDSFVQQEQAKGLLHNLCGMATGSVRTTQPARVHRGPGCLGSFADTPPRGRRPRYKRALRSRLVEMRSRPATKNDGLPHGGWLCTGKSRPKAYSTICAEWRRIQSERHLAKTPTPHDHFGMLVQPRELERAGDAVIANQKARPAAQRLDLLQNRRQQIQTDRIQTHLTNLRTIHASP